MYKSNIAVEQIAGDFSVVEDFGEILSPSEMTDILRAHFEGVQYHNGCIYGTHNAIPYCIYFKNVSYLGTPHAFFKKRIQIGDNFKDIYRENCENGIKTLLLGIYKYKDVILFVDFDVLKYAARKSHNSSAHVYTIDLRNGLIFGIFQKEDINKNIITVFNTNNVVRFLDGKLTNGGNFKLDFVSVLDDFYAALPKKWNGISCYQEMITANFNNALQPEWPGFYQEYRLSKYIHEKQAEHIILYSQNKKKGDIDLDLYFPQILCYGDLKAHSNDSSGIQGNDWDTIMRLLENSSIYYVVCNHDTEKDQYHNNEVTTFWNTRLGKTNLLSYAGKMKHSVTLTSYTILEINKYNKQYLDVFHQGHNSDGNAREPKIQIKKKNINNFLIHQIVF